MSHFRVYTDYMTILFTISELAHGDPGSDMPAVSGIWRVARGDPGSGMRTVPGCYQRDLAFGYQCISSNNLIQGMLNGNPFFIFIEKR